MTWSTGRAKGLANFDRLFERVDRLVGKTTLSPPSSKRISGEMLQTDAEPFVKAVMELKMKFLDSMDDDFNTAGAIGVLQQFAGEINSHIERTGAEKDKTPEAITAIAAASQTLRALGGLLGLIHATREHGHRASARRRCRGEEPGRATHAVDHSTPHVRPRKERLRHRRRDSRWVGEDEDYAGRSRRWDGVEERMTRRQGDKVRGGEIALLDLVTPSPCHLVIRCASSESIPAYKSQAMA